jgi:ABC-type nitrate/sulfonate/bicarbonate transport system substrate-binding protein
MTARQPLLLFAAVFAWTVAHSIALGQEPKSTVKVHSPGRSILSVPFQIAEDQGFYKDEALNVEFIAMATGAGVQALIAGDVDASQILGLTLRAAINRGAPLKIVMVFNDRPTYWLMSKKEITSSEELKGKIIASSSPGASSDVLLQRWLAKNGLAPKKDVTIVYIGATAITYQALVRGSVGAAVLVPPFDTHAKRQGFLRAGEFRQGRSRPFSRRRCERERQISARASRCDDAISTGDLARSQIAQDQPKGFGADFSEVPESTARDR